MSLRLPVTAAIAVLLASLSLSSVLQGNGWLGAGLGAIIVVAGAGVAARLPGLRPAAVAAAAALIAVVPLLFWPGWPALIAGLAIVALTAASATGAGPLRGLAVLVLYVAALLIYLNIWFAGDMSYAHLIPSHASLHQLGVMVHEAFQEFRFAPPVADSRAVSLVGAGGIGLVAIMVDLLAVRLRRPATAGLPLLVLFSVPVASDLKTFGAWQAVTFAAGMAGFLMLLSTAGRDRLRMWGRLVTFRYVQRTDEAGTGPDTRELAASGRRIGLAAVCLAVIVPLVVPTLAKQDVFGASGGGPGHAGGGGSGTGLDPMLDVQKALRERTPQTVFTYNTNSTDPTGQYFQVYVLNYNATQDNWVPMFTDAQQPVQVGQPLPYQPASATAATVTTTVRLTPSQVQFDDAGYLPVPYAPVKLSASTASGWSEKRASLMLFNVSPLQSGLQYTVTSSEADPSGVNINDSAATVPPSISNQYGNYSGPDINRLKAIESQHTAHANSPLDAALALQNWLLSSHFHYSVKPRLPGSHWLLKFLTTSRRGYCQQFAWAMAVLARLYGIPARIAVGYTAGTVATTAGHGGATGRVTTADAHAWPELYFAGEGWLRFEPTPHATGSPGQGTATVPAYAASAAGVGGTPGSGGGSSTGSTGPSGQSSTGPNPSKLTGHGTPGQAGGPVPTAGSGLWLAIAIPLLVLALLLAPAVARRVTRRRRWLAASDDAAAAAAAWRELTDDLTDYGLARAPGETPRSLARRLTAEAGLDEAAAQSLRRIVAATERATYGRLAQPGAGLSADSSRVRRAIAGAVPKRQRIRAGLLPASTLAALQDALQSAGDKLSWLDTSWPAMRRQASWPALRRQQGWTQSTPADAMARIGR
jgi:transglutaminase-like putative cysteine protease